MHSPPASPSFQLQPIFSLGARRLRSQHPAMPAAGSEPDGLKRTHSDSVSGGATRQGPWRCAICSKEFSQKEYRNKHQQRCTKASISQRLSKQKSCVACAASKLRCNLGMPSCSRCSSRNKPCQYVTTAVETSVQHEGRQGQQPDIDSQGGQRQFPFFANEAFSSLGENVASLDSDTAAGFEAFMSASTDPGRGAAYGDSMTLSSIQLLQHNRLPSFASNASLDSWPTGSPHVRLNIPHQPLDGPFGDSAMSADWFRRNIGTIVSENGAATPHWQRNESCPATSPFKTSNASISAHLDDDAAANAMTGIANDDFNFDLLSSMGMLTRDHIAPAPNSQPSPASTIQHTPASTPSSSMWMAPQARNVAAGNPNPSTSAKEGDGKLETLYEAVKTTNGEGPLSALAMRRNLQATEQQLPCLFHKLDTVDNAVRIVSSYPRTMTRPGMYPPFVHHKLYPCAEGDIAEPLARAFCCVGALYASLPTSEAFVHSLINEESRKLIKGFHQWTGSDIDMLAAVHAMCIYQTLGFFVYSSPDHARQAELRHLYFLKMTRHLIQQHIQHLQPTAGEESEEVNWKKWIINETIRRTFFLVNTINTLSCRIQKQDPYYFEPLDDKLIGNMSLPAPEVLWKASSAVEWMAAKAQLTPEVTARSRLTLLQVIEQLSADSDDGDDQSTGNPQQLSNGTCRVQYGQLDEFTRLVIATVGKT
ncbi:Uncharacterized protein TCAP_05471 [Tolypocladium capitatum]|uniref:Zn(2)-C6 fungal-type domain-containing protein n=1 Tax=Tolypocladium capitatum TaxID=45235 RepID=A0A2K3QAM3_9HYPO|nr:Uncharacterized protein TCAP_05471 [Tolypocladium capitatum]